MKIFANEKRHCIGKQSKQWTSMSMSQLRNTNSMPHLLGVEYEPLPVLILALLYRLQPLDPRQPRVQQLPHRAKLHTGNIFYKIFLEVLRKYFADLVPGDAEAGQQRGGGEQLRRPLRHSPHLGGRGDGALGGEGHAFTMH